MSAVKGQKDLTIQPHVGLAATLKAVRRLLLVLFVLACTPAELRVTNPGVSGDGGTGDHDAGLDAGGADSGLADSGVPDSGLADAGLPDSGLADSGVPDSGLADAGAPDSGLADAGAPDSGLTDSGVPDSGLADAGAPDSGLADAGVADSGIPDAGQCPAVPSIAPDVDPWSVRLPSAGFGGTAVQLTGGHSDVFLKSASPADYTRIGVRLDWGGTVVFWGLSANAGSNTIDANDTGRELQIALYDPARIRQSCAWNASCLNTSATCGNSITFLGWDPVQGGDECNHGATATWSIVNQDTLRVTVTPVQWNPDWDAVDCRSTPCAATPRTASVRYVMDLRYVHSLVVELSLEVQSFETIDHGVTAQEFPTLYVSHGGAGPDLKTLLDAAGQAITIDQPANDGFFVKNFASPHPWVSFQNATKDYGVGLAMDQGVTSFQGWSGNGSTAPYFHNVRANLSFGLSHGAVVRGRAYLALGGFSTIDTTLTTLLSQRAPFGAVDSPTAGSTAHGLIPVSGWVLDSTPLTSVRLEVDGVLAATLPVDQARPDVCQVYPAWAACPTVGYTGSLPTAGLDACVHRLDVVAVDADGNRTVLGQRLIQR